METRDDGITVSVESCGKYIQITKPGTFESPCAVSFRPEQIDRLNRWLRRAKTEALELRESAMNMANEGGPL